jgi:hypothetical protein
MKLIKRLKGYRVLVNTGMFNANSTVYSVSDVDIRDRNIKGNWKELREHLALLTLQFEKNCNCTKENSEHSVDCNTILLRRVCNEFESILFED